MIIIDRDVMCFFKKNSCILICIGNNRHEKHDYNNKFLQRARF